MTESKERREWMLYRMELDGRDTTVAYDDGVELAQGERVFVVEKSELEKAQAELKLCHKLRGENYAEAAKQYQNLSEKYNETLAEIEILKAQLAQAIEDLELIAAPDWDMALMLKSKTLETAKDIVESDTKIARRALARIEAIREEMTR